MILLVMLFTLGFNSFATAQELDIWEDSNGHLWVENAFYKWDITHGSSLVIKTGDEWRDWRISGYESYRLELGRGGGGGQPYDRLFMSDLNVDNISNNGQTAVAELSGIFAGLQPVTLMITFYANSGLIKMDYSVGNVTDYPNPPSIFHKFSFVPGGNVSGNDFYYYSGQTIEQAFPYNSWTHIHRSNFQTVGNTNYIFITDYDKDNRQGFAMISRFDHTADMITDINYGIAIILDYHPYRGYSSMSLNLNSVVSPTVYWYFYETDPVTAYQPVEDLINGWGLGSICASVNIAGDPQTPTEGVSVTILDQNNDPVADPQQTDFNGEAFFDDLPFGEYSVMIVTPLGYSVSPAETQTSINVSGGDCTQVDFVLTPIIVSNNCRTIGYWKHQFNVYTNNRGNAQESETDLINYLDIVYQHFDELDVYIDLENFDFDDAKNILTVRGGSLMIDRAKQQLFALHLNFASGRIGNETVVSDDGRVAAEAVTHVANLINDGNLVNDELAKDICDFINNGQMVNPGVIPFSNVRYKGLFGNNLPINISLSQNFPNPFNPTTTIEYALPEASHVTLDVYDILGRKVTTLVSELKQPGYHQVTWNAADQTSGMYFYKIQAGDFTETKKMLLLK